MEEIVEWLQSISFGINTDKDIVRIEFKSTTKNPINSDADKVQTIFVPTLVYRDMINILIDGGKQIEKDFGINLKLNGLREDESVE